MNCMQEEMVLEIAKYIHRNMEVSGLCDLIPRMRKRGGGEELVTLQINLQYKKFTGEIEECYLVLDVRENTVNYVGYQMLKLLVVHSTDWKKINDLIQFIIGIELRQYEWQVKAGNNIALKM